MAAVIAEAGESVSPAELMGSLEERVPGAAEALSSSALLQDERVDADTLADDLVRRVKEFELERRIAVGKAKLRQPELFSDPTEYDELFSEMSSLQRELEVLKRSSTDT